MSRTISIQEPMVNLQVKVGKTLILSVIQAISPSPLSCRCVHISLETAGVNDVDVLLTV